jgi:hypothetical protein
VVCAVLAAAGGCTCGEAVLSVDLTVASRATTTRCVQVVALPDGGKEAPSGNLARTDGKDAFQVAVYQGNLPELIDVVARGYDDPDCTRLNEQTPLNSVRFDRGQVTHVPLKLNGSPCVGADAGTACPSGICRSDQACADAGTEFDCTNGRDDDGDGLNDCADPDCLGVACNSADLCQVGTTCQADGGCGSTTSKACDMPPGFCFGNPGTCSPSTGVCAYTPDAGIGCDDSNACTGPDHCLADAGCGGDPVVCNTPPPGACFVAIGNCDPLTGCSYPARPDGGCDDGNLCTFNDRCGSDAGCTGTPYTCPSTQCATQGCLGDGGCSPAVIRTGQLCDGGTGVCNGTGSCLVFPYAPSNFDPVTIAPTLVLPDGGVPAAINLGCVATFNSTDGGFNWCSGQPLPAFTVISQPGGPNAMVLSMTGLTVTGTLNLIGSRPVILAVWGDVTVPSTGTISAASTLAGNDGAGQGSSGCTAENGFNDANTGGGGAGGGYGTRGADGGNGNATAHGGRGGAPFGGVIIQPLVAGCPGGTGGKSSPNTGGAGGSGGGAVQISAAGTLNIAGVVTASAAGGSGGMSVNPKANGGGGGGSGGSVLLEGWRILIPSTAKLTANGGGGGEGSNNSGADGTNGGDGSQTNATPVGSGNNTICGGSGGTSGTATAAPGPGVNSTSNCGGGGGGGAVGKVTVNAPFTCQMDAGVQSPKATTLGNCN